MPSLIGSLFVSLTADFAPFQRNMRSAEGVVASTSAGMRRSMGLTAKSVDSFNRSVNTGIRPYALLSAARTFDTVQQRANLLRGALFATTAAFGGLGAALTSNVVSRYLDSFTGLENQIRVVSDSSADLASQIALVGDVAEKSRSGLAATATLYSRLAKAAPDEAPIKLLRRVETISKALQLGGATAQEAASAAVQFSQAIASNRLGGEELRAVLETPLGLELAKGLGVTIGKFREMGYAGELTAEVLFKALDKIQGAIDQQFAGSVATIDQALTVVDGQITAFAGKLDDTYGITRILTGGIFSFGDSLETIVPLLAQIGLLLGSTFAGRLGGGVAGRIGARVQVIKDEIAFRRENLRLAQEEFAVAQKATEEATRRARVASAIGPDRAREFADPSVLKTYQRSLAALEKEDRRYLGLIQEQHQARRTLGAITAQTTVGALRASEALAAAQIKQNGLLQEQSRLKTEERRANSKLTAALGQQTQNTSKIRAVAEAEKEVARVQNQRAAISQRISDQDKAIADRQIAITNLRTQAEVAAANERAAALVKESQVRAALARSDERRTALSQTTRLAGGLVTASGQSKINAEALDASSGLIRTQAAALSAGTALSVMQRAASGTAIAINTMRNVGASFVGFLGGPWGVAITGAMVLLGYFAARAAETAQTVAEAERLIAENLPQTVQAAENAEAFVLDKQIEVIGSQITTLANASETFRGQIRGLLATTNEALFAESVEGTAAVQALLAELESGAISITTFKQRLDDLSQTNMIVAGVRDEIVKLATKIVNATGTITTLRTEFDSLNGRRANLFVNVSVIDPLGVFSGKPMGIPGGAELAKQYGQYGAGQVAARNQTRLSEFKSGILNAAGETDKIKNTPQKIRDRAQALLEEAGNLGLTRAEAEKLAAAELNLTEQTRKAGQGAGAAAKEYQTFANKIAELRETASGAFLSDIDRRVLDFADNLKDGSTMMREYIAAVNSGDLSQAPKQLLQVRDALMQIDAADAWQGILQKYGTGAQLAQTFADKQAQLNILVASGRITAEQAGAAYADFISQFGNYEWVNQLSSALVQFADTAITDFENIEDAAMSLLKAIGRIILQLTVLGPLENTLKGIFGGASGGGGLGGLFSGLGALFGLGGGFVDMPGVGLYHEGATAGWGDAIRLHNGNLKPNEYKAILEEGETVLTDADTRKTFGMINAMSQGMKGGGGGGGGVLEVALSPDLVGRILTEAENQSISISRDTVDVFNRNALPGRVNRILQEPRTVGAR